MPRCYRLAEVYVDEGDTSELHGYLGRARSTWWRKIPAAEPQVERAVDRRSRRKKAAIDLKPDMTTDSLQLFLKTSARSGCSPHKKRLTWQAHRARTSTPSRRWSSPPAPGGVIAKNYRNQGCLSSPDPRGTLGLVLALEIRRPKGF